MKCHLQAGVQNRPKVQAGGHVFHQRRASVGNKEEFKESEIEVTRLNNLVTRMIGREPGDRSLEPSEHLLFTD